MTITRAVVYKNIQFSIIPSINFVSKWIDLTIKLPYHDWMLKEFSHAQQPSCQNSGPHCTDGLLVPVPIPQSSMPWLQFPQFFSFRSSGVSARAAVNQFSWSKRSRFIPHWSAMVVLDEPNSLRIYSTLIYEGSMSGCSAFTCSCLLILLWTWVMLLCLHSILGDSRRFTLAQQTSKDHLIPPPWALRNLMRNLQYVLLGWSC